MQPADQTWHIRLFVRIMLMITQIHAAIYTKTFESYIGVYDNNFTYNWSSALSYCESQYGTSLASIHSSMDEISIGSARYTKNATAWIGLTDIQEEGFWVWSDGTDYDYNISFTTNDTYFILNLSLYQDCAKMLSSNLNTSCNSSSMQCIKFSEELCSDLSNQFVCNNVKFVPLTILTSLYLEWAFGSVCFIVCFEGCLLVIYIEHETQINASINALCEDAIYSCYNMKDRIHNVRYSHAADSKSIGTKSNSANSVRNTPRKIINSVRYKANGNTVVKPVVNVDQSVVMRQNRQSSFETKYIYDKNARIVGSNWYLGETVGKGAFGWVKRGFDVDTGDIVALKFIPPSINLTEQKFDQQIDSEITVLSKISHPHIVSLLDYVLNCPYPANTDTNGIQLIDTTLFVFEFARKGELFNVLHYTGQFPENICATYIRQLISGLECLHLHGVIHRDIKPSNILLDDDFNLMIADLGLCKIFDFPQHGDKYNKNHDERTQFEFNHIGTKDDSLNESDISENDSNEDENENDQEKQEKTNSNNSVLAQLTMKAEEVGTRGYKAPEIVLRVEYGTPCDIFSAGVLLFNLLSAYQPFASSRVDDEIYKHLKQNNFNTFWNIHKQRSMFYSKVAKDLFQQMVEFDPIKRITIENIKQHDWYIKTPFLKTKKLKHQMVSRFKEMKTKREVAKASKTIQQNPTENGRKTPANKNKKQEGIAAAILMSSPQPNATQVEYVYCNTVC